MTKFACCLIAGLAVLALSGFSSQAAPVPQRATGIWSLGPCGGDGLSVLVNSAAALMVETEGEQSHVAILKAEWVAGSFVLASKDIGDDLVLPPLEQFQRCGFLPPSMSGPFAEAVTVFKRLDEIEAACSGEATNVARCIAVAFDVVDVTGNGLLSRAELSRGRQAAEFFFDYRWAVDKQREAEGESAGADAARGPAFVLLEKLYAGDASASRVFMSAPSNLIQSYDFDGDGFLSLQEVMQDRIPETGPEGALANTALRLLPPALSAFLRSLAVGFDLLP